MNCFKSKFNAQSMIIPTILCDTLNLTLIYFNIFVVVKTKQIYFSITIKYKLNTF